MSDETQTASIIGEKYRGKYKGASDWIGEVIQANCSTQPMKTVKDAEGNETEVAKGKSVLNVDALISLSKANHIDTSKMEEQRDRKNAPGRIRMTLGNMLRAAARKRHGLYINGEWVEAPEAFLESAPDEPTETRDGEKIVKAKPAAETDGEAA